MKKKLLVTALIASMILSMAGCGEKETTESGNAAVNSSETQSVEASEAEKETPTEAPSEAPEVKDELPNWKGVYDNVGATILNQGTFGIEIAYPSLKPASSGCAYQMDPALVLVCTPHKDENGEYVVIENVEDTLSASNTCISMWLEDYRGFPSSDFNFVVENQELLTINDMPTCKYEGTHTYVADGTSHEIPFVAYSFYTGQLEGYSYFTVIVMDDSINCPSMEPLPEGTIDVYARKMVESVELK